MRSKMTDTKDKKEISVNDLDWKTVQISDTLDDYNGFYGLEEIEGVGVKVVDGKAVFYTTDKHVKQKNLQQDANEEEEQEGDEEMELIEFKNMDDLEDGELSSAASDSESDGDDEENYESAQENEDELKTNVFTTDIDLENVDVELPEWKKLGRLSMTVLNGLSRLNFVNPTEIQKAAIPQALEGKDIMGKASTGSGKTLAYGIPIIEKLISSYHQKDHSKAIALIFTPTRELAQQVTKHLINLAEIVVQDKNKYVIMSLTGGLSIQKQERLLKYDGSGRIIIATPGRFLELLQKNNELVERFAQIDSLVLDEADRLLQDGHFDEFENILKVLSQKRRELRGKHDYWQTMIFSATFSIDLFNKLSSNHSKIQKKGNDDKDELEIVLKHLMTKIHFKSKPTIIDTNPEDKVSSQIKESLIECAPLERDLYVYYFLLMYPGQTLIFCNAIDSVKKLTALLNLLKISTFQIHSSMTQKNRLKNLERYQKQSHQNNILNKPTVLIASDVAARGLDIPGIQHVIHYHLPRTADVYIHRSGRTARATNEGVSVMICSPQEAMGPLRKLRKLLADPNKKKRGNKNVKWQKTVPQMPIETDIVSQIRERVQLATQLADHDIASTSLHKDDTWLKKAADDLGIDVDSEDEMADTFLAKNKTKKMNKTLSKDKYKVKKYELNELLRNPIRKDLRKKYLTGGLINLADNLVKKRGHDTIIGGEKTDALQVLKKKKK